jgi:hypothetical protein
MGYDKELVKAIVQRRKRAGGTLYYMYIRT